MPTVRPPRPLAVSVAHSWSTSVCQDLLQALLVGDVVVEGGLPGFGDHLALLG